MTSHYLGYEIVVSSFVVTGQVVEPVEVEKFLLYNLRLRVGKCTVKLSMDTTSQFCMSLAWNSVVPYGDGHFGSLQFAA